MSGKRRRFTEEFKREAVTLATSLGSVAQAAEDLAVSPNSLYQWMKKYGSGKRLAGASEVLEAEELRQLRREVKQLKLERDFLKKAAAFFAQDARNDTSA